MEYVKVLLPSIVVGLIFWYVIRAIIKSDSIERKQMDKYYAQLAESEKSAPESANSEDAPTTDTQGGSHGKGNETRLN